MKLVHYYGKTEPFIAVGKNQCHLLSFAIKYPSWHTFKNDRATKNAVNALSDKGYIVVQGNQFKLNY